MAGSLTEVTNSSSPAYLDSSTRLICLFGTVDDQFLHHVHQAVQGLDINPDALWNMLCPVSDTGLVVCSPSVAASFHCHPIGARGGAVVPCWSPGRPPTDAAVSAALSNLATAGPMSADSSPVKQGFLSEPSECLAHKEESLSRQLTDIFPLLRPSRRLSWNAPIQTCGVASMADEPFIVWVARNISWMSSGSSPSVSSLTRSLSKSAICSSASSMNTFSSSARPRTEDPPLASSCVPFRPLLLKSTSYPCAGLRNRCCRDSLAPSLLHTNGIPLSPHRPAAAYVQQYHQLRFQLCHASM